MSLKSKFLGVMFVVSLLAVLRVDSKTFAGFLGTMLWPAVFGVAWHHFR